MNSNGGIRLDKGKMLWTVLGFGVALCVIGAAAYFYNTDGQPEEEEEEPVQPKGGVYLMMIEGVDGEAQDKDHEGWMLLDSFAFPTIKVAGGGGRTGGERTYEPIRIVKRIDKSSPKLIDMTVKGSLLTKVVVKYCRITDDGGLRTIMVYEFKNAAIGSYWSTSGDADPRPTEDFSVGGSGGEDSYVPTYQPFFDVGKGWVPNRPSETVSFSFEEVKVTYTEFDNDGKSKGNVETEFKTTLPDEV
jgi:type VI protein secretion system component Hcp